MAATPIPPSPTVIHDFVCTACGCMCDDLVLTVEDNRITSISPLCPLAEAFLLAERDDAGPSCFIHGQPVELAAAVEHATSLLRSARAPLVMGIERATCDSQRLAVEIADRLGAFLDPTDDCGASRSHAAVQTVGAVTATLGEVAARSDLVVYWECDPATTHPRHMDRFASRDGQHVVVVANWPTPSAALAGEYLLIPMGSGFECLAIVRALVKGVALDAEFVELRTGNSLDAWRKLSERFKESRYAAIFFDGLDGGAEAKTQAITELALDMHRFARVAALPLGVPFNAMGAAQVLTWQTGFPAAISFARGFPQYLPDEATASQLLSRREVDAALVIAAHPLAHLSAAGQAHLGSIPLVVLDDRATTTSNAAAVAFRIAPFGVAAPGDVYRSDGVALPLRPAVRSTRPTATDVLTRLAAALAD
jgi:formylmethanofuran dehydrogenase subunit B